MPESTYASDPNWRPDPVKVAEHIAAREAAICAQQLVVGRLYELWDAADRELIRMQRSLTDFRDAVTNYVPVADR